MKFIKPRANRCLLVLPLLFASAAWADTCDQICTDGEDCIAAGVYPYVPNPESFTKAICDAWTSIGYGTKLYLIADDSVWDGGYGSNPTYTNGSGTEVPIDVITYDAMNLEHFKKLTVTIPSASISDQSDFVSYADKALTTSGGDMYALPLLGCTNIQRDRPCSRTDRHPRNLSRLCRKGANGGHERL